MTSPIMLLPDSQQRQPPLECFDVFAHGAFFASGAKRRDDDAGNPRQRWWVKRIFKTQRTEILQSRSDPGQRPRSVQSLTTAFQPMRYSGDDLADEGNRKLGTVQISRPTLDCGGIGKTIRILQLGSAFPRTVLGKAQLQCLPAAPAGCMRVRK